MKLRLLITEKCNRNCEGCCNKDWDLSVLPKETDYSQYNTILLTGGEPMLSPFYVINIIKMIRKQNKTGAIILYTAKIDDWNAVLAVLHYIDGLTVTLHEQKDVGAFVFLDSLLSNADLAGKSLRLNVFKGVTISKKYGCNLKNWKVKDNIEWIKNCPLPEGEVFKRI